ncbi:MAG TPA: chemotaxis protein CheW [Terriglobales bacterium]|nr:chemotaxis protein CheW [Terriglobales bacterium]
MAIPLSTLDRLEEFAVSKIEMSGAQWVTQYRGQILPLVRLNVILEERRHKLQGLQSLPPSGSSPVQVLVLNHEGYSFGLVVDKILDIVEDRAEVKTPATRPCVLYSVVIGERVTELLDIAAIVSRNASQAAAQKPSLKRAARGAN